MSITTYIPKILEWIRIIDGDKHMNDILKELSLFLQIPEQDIRPAVSFPGYFITAYGDIVSCLGRAPRCLKHL